MTRFIFNFRGQDLVALYEYFPAPVGQSASVHIEALYLYSESQGLLRDSTIEVTELVFSILGGEDVAMDIVEDALLIQLGGKA